MNYRFYWPFLLFAILGVMALWLIGFSFQPAMARSLNVFHDQAGSATVAPTGAPQPTAGTPGLTGATSMAVPTCVPAPTAQPTLGTAAPTGSAQLATPTCVPGGAAQPTGSTSVATVPTTAGTGTPAATAAPTSASTTGQPGKVNIDAIAPPAPGRDLLFDNCTSCHSWVCAVVGQRSAGAWQTVKTTHRQRVTALSDQDYNTLFDYLSSNFNDQKPQPDLPPELASQGCTAQ